MQLSFWDTTKGHFLADTLCKYLPVLAKKKEQVMENVPLCYVDNKICSYLRKGYVLHDHIAISDERVILIFEK